MLWFLKIIMSRNVFLYTGKELHNDMGKNFYISSFRMIPCLSTPHSVSIPVMHVMLEAHRQKKEQEYEIPPWVFFCSTAMIVLLYMHACTLAVNRP